MKIDPAYLDKLLSFLQPGYHAVPEEREGEFNILWKGHDTGYSIVQDEDVPGQFYVTVAVRSWVVYGEPPTVDILPVSASAVWETTCCALVRELLNAVIDTYHESLADGEENVG